MLDTSHDLEQAQREIGVPVEQLIAPHSSVRRSEWFAIDNGAFSAFDEGRFLGLLKRERAAQKTCRFVVVPDVPFDARRTLEVFRFWQRRLACDGWKVALAAQDGQEELEIPWARIDALFIGGSTNWKMGPHAAACIRAAQAIGKWVHVGRVNGAERWDYFDEELKVNSGDGSGVAQYTKMRWAIKNGKLQQKLFPPADCAPGALVSVPEIGLVGTAPVLGEDRANGQGTQESSEPSISKRVRHF